MEEENSSSSRSTTTTTTIDASECVNGNIYDAVLCVLGGGGLLSAHTVATSLCVCVLYSAARASCCPLDKHG